MHGGGGIFATFPPVFVLYIGFPTLHRVEDMRGVLARYRFWHHERGLLCHIGEHHSLQKPAFLLCG